MGREWVNFAYTSLLSNAAFGITTPMPLKCQLIDMTTHKHKVLDTQTAHYEPHGGGGIGVDVELKSGQLSVEVWSGTEGSEDTEFVKSITIKEKGIYKVSSESRDESLPTFFSLDYRPGLDSHGRFKKIYKVECRINN